MTAILPALIAVDMEFLTAVRTSKIIDRLTLYLVEMAVPPLITALVAAEAFFLPLDNLLNLASAVLAGGRLARERHGSLHSRIRVYFVPAAE